MACTFNLRTDTQATAASLGGTWTYQGVSAWTVNVDGSPVTLNQGDTIGVNDDPQITTDPSHVGNSYVVRYTVPATVSCAEVSADYTINVAEEPCAIGDGSVNICEGALPNYTMVNYLDTSLCGGTPTIDEWVLVSGDGTGVNLTTGIFDPDGYTSGDVIVVQARIFGVGNDVCGSCGTAQANLTINIVSGADAGSGGTIDICA